MEKVTVELLNDHALQLLRQLESMKILRVIKTSEGSRATKQKWAGRISKETAAKMLHDIEQSRKEWERNI